MKGTMHCPICGHDKPHGHTEETLRIERAVRPAFEEFISKKIQEGWWRDKIKNIGNGWGSGHPYSIVSRDGHVGYPAAFGWNGVRRAQTFDGDIAYGDDHWTHRASVNSRYTNADIEMLWQIYREVRAQGHQSERSETAVQRLAIDVPSLWRAFREGWDPLLKEERLAFARLDNVIAQVHESQLNGPERKALYDSYDDGNGPYMEGGYMVDGHITTHPLWADFKTWAERNLGQGYSLACHEGGLCDQVTSWCYDGYRAGRLHSAPAASGNDAAAPANEHVEFRDCGMETCRSCYPFGLRHFIGAMAATVPAPAGLHEPKDPP